VAAGAGGGGKLDAAGGLVAGKEKALRICETWRIPYADSLDALAAQCDAVFVHTSTASHYEVVNRLLNAGVHVCVDKPLADKLSEAETLVELAARRHLTLMVGFNRRFAPLYRELKGQLGEAASLRMDKHRSDSVGNDLRFTLLDDYLHVVDTALWLAGGQARLRGGALQITPRAKCCMPNTSSVRPGCRSPPACTAAPAASASGCRRSPTAGYMPSARCANGRRSGQGVVQRPVAGWQTTLEQRGFAGCARHFIECVQNQTVPETAGEQALLAQRVVEKLWRDAMSE
jgi:virulence factor